ncbi:MULTISPECIES: ribonuclease Z [Roseivirga]|uniref:ribonuclease Z n=1 Tax=Roseivirga TaxID=290180 RepID=UPI000D78E417|nr:MULTISPECIES: ribonuclease Z [Roseivirga]PWL28376.1 MAG: ribonuclease Z [Roseivirga sp. XM-24bin3]MBO6494353.1 ribonuclease Z [Roseivirga sp.]MBO6659327.1 ribonuclease Z [Roseivirga sp.]MBO6761184.1 ribonuclease Z [Roseivirga sp.]MBO6907936.1 ribonuclease Z [Roseivirga sp.]
MSIRVKILGSNSATPAHRRHHTSQLVNVEGKYYMIDCGEATQLQLKRYKLRAQRINNIFISHLHGDHYLGLMGLLSSMHLMGRNKPLNLYGPRGLSEIITLQLKYSDTAFNYDVAFHEVDTQKFQLIHEDELISVHSIPLDHRIPCCGFLFEEKPKNRRLIRETIPEDLSVRNIIRLKKGEDIFDEEGKLLFKNEDMTLPPRQSFKYAYCSDTKYNESIIPIIEGSDMLYHESTFLEEHRDRAHNTFHSTAKEAATIAEKAKVGKLLLGHFSARYKELEPIQEEARLVFPESHLAIEGEEYILDS